MPNPGGLFSRGGRTLVGMLHLPPTRRRLGLDQVAILADVSDRTSTQVVDVASPELANWAVHHGNANGLVITGRDVAETHRMLAELRAGDLDVPLIVGGGADETNASDLLAVADGVRVATALKDNPAFDALISATRARGFVTAVRPREQTGTRGSGSLTSVKATLMRRRQHGEGEKYAFALSLRWSCALLPVGRRT